jgi:hypothetical protein
VPAVGRQEVKSEPKITGVKVSKKGEVVFDFDNGHEETWEGIERKPSHPRGAGTTWVSSGRQK